MLMYILLALAFVVVAFLIVATLQPSEFRVSRSATFSAPPAAAFAQVNDFHKWAAWNPFAKADPAAANTFEGAPSGTGAITTWSGNNKIGAGRMTIVESRPSELIRIKLEFFRPLANVCTAEFSFKPAGDRTVVTWAMFGPNNFIGKMMHLVFSMEKMVGGNFEKGLADMRVAAESALSKAG